MGGSSGGNSHRATKHTTELRYAPYLESRHNPFLTSYDSTVDGLIDNTPFDDHTDIELDSAYFTVGTTMVNYSIVYDLFHTFMYTKNVNVAFLDTFDRLVTNEEDDAMLAKVQIDLNDKVERNDLRTLSEEARRINAVNSTTFIINKARVEKARVRELNAISTKVKVNSFKEVGKYFNDTMTYYHGLVIDYMEMIRSYYEVKIPVTTNNFDYLAQQFLWPFTLLDQQKRAVAIMEVPNNIDLSAPRQIAKKKSSNLAKGISILSGIYTGYYYGGMIGSYFGPVGYVIGAIVGAIIGGIAGWLTS